MLKTKGYIKPEDYLEIERKAEYKSEYYKGEMFAMSGASKEHNIISTNITGILFNQLLNKPCQVFHSDLRVKAIPSGLYTYPDIIVVCGEQKFEDAQLNTLLNPTLIIEILSDSTEDFDRGTKFVNYRQINSLKEYILVSQNKMKIEKYIRQGENKWLLTEESNSEKTVELPSINCLLLLKEVYRNIKFGEATNPPAAKAG